MVSGSTSSITTCGWVVLCLCVALPAGAAQDEAADARAATALESMLAGHVCGQPKSLDPEDQDARERCVEEQRLALRAAFGYDLGRLTAAERRRLDATCSRFRTNYDVEPYLKCLTHGLVSLRAAWTPGESGLPSFGTRTAVPPADPPAAPTRRWPAVIVALLAGAALAGVALAAVTLWKRRRRIERRCHDCDAPMQSAGDLCPGCRHRAALTMKQATADRAEQKRAEQETLRHRREDAEERQREREEQEAQLRRDAEERRAEQARRAAEPPPPPDETSRQPAADTPEVFDPYAVLGVSPEASYKDIETAYRDARSRYNESQVAHLGDEVRMHFKVKADAVEEAYRTLSRSIPA